MSVIEALIGAVQGRLRAMSSGLRFGKFASVGVLGAVLDTSVTLTLSDVFLVNPDLSKFVGAEMAIVLMFFVNEHWTFKSEGTEGILPLGRRLLKIGRAHV